MATGRGSFRHTIAVRYGEVDLQGVVFNAHYLAYMDDTMETWLRPLRKRREELGWEMMLKRCTIEWQGSLGPGDVLDVDVAVERWGRTSWDLGYLGTCEGRQVFRALVVYVSVRLGEGEPMETPEEIRAFLGDPIDLVGPFPS